MNSAQANYEIKQQISNALGNAMEAGKAFSWIKTQDVQAGVYLKYSQSHFQTYKMLGIV